MSVARGRVFIAVLGLVWAGALVAQPVYKWVDAQGQTHYGSQLPPQQADAAQLKVSPNGSSGAGAGRFGEQRNTDGTKKLPKEAQELVDGLTAARSRPCWKTARKTSRAAISPRRNMTARQEV